MIKEIPILFSTSMVQAILEGRKSQTRRVVKFRNKKWRLSYEANEEGRTDLDAFGVLDKHGNLVEIEEGEPASLKELELCPYGKPGDILWVRESWQLKGWDFEEGTMQVKFKTGETHKYLAHDPDEDSSWLMDKVDYLEDRGYIKPDPANKEMFVFTDKKQPFLPSIHMPKEAARIWLKVESVRVERLQDISEADAIAEGIMRCQRVVGAGYGYFDYSGKPTPNSYNWGCPIKSFCTLWQSINGADSWQANPWVWVVSFKVLSTTGKPDYV